ncbi:MAG: endo alpha-1,4 polygalactosaminidase [Bacteroidota bacterium]
MRNKYLLFFLFLMIFSCTKDENPIVEINTKLGKIHWWMYQLQGFEDENALIELSQTEYELLVIEPGDDFKEEPYNTKYMLNRLRKTPSGKTRLIFAYINIGEAEDYRSYWGNNWTIGSPNFLISSDPDGWSGNYPVAYWKQEWKNIWIGDSNRIQKLVDLGFDGVYLDWVEAYDDEKTRNTAVSQNINPELEMLNFIQEIKNTGKAKNANFMVIAQNAPYLIDYDAGKYKSAIDAIALEDTWFHGKADASWYDPLAGDIPNADANESSTMGKLKQCKKLLDNNIPVFTVDYCVSRENADGVYEEAARNGLKSLVTRVSLSKNTETPPLNMNVK